MPTIKDLYPQLFPERHPDPIWNTHAEQIEQQLYKLKNENNYFGLFIRSIQAQIEFMSKKRDVADHSFVVRLTNPDLIVLKEKHPDIRYILALCRLRGHSLTIEFLLEVLQCLTAIQRNDNSYIPMSSETKYKIRTLFYKGVLQDYDHIDIYLQIIGEDDDQHCKRDKENSCHN
jgi:hypothetical protein